MVTSGLKAPMQENTLTVNGETISVPEISLLELETLKPELDLINEPGDSNAPKGGWDKARAMAKIVIPCQYRRGPTSVRLLSLNFYRHCRDVGKPPRKANSKGPGVPEVIAVRPSPWS
jgi:hypothetical protein